LGALGDPGSADLTLLTGAAGTGAAVGTADAAASQLRLVT